jgi:ABC-type amino acid transport substrate-binding protein
VNNALATLRANGTLSALQNQYLGIYLHFPTIKP